jgi:hypothetical protein
VHVQMRVWEAYVLVFVKCVCMGRTENKIHSKAQLNKKKTSFTMWVTQSHA